MDNKQEFKNFLKALKGAIILFAGICAGIGSLNYSSVGGPSFFAIVGVLSIICTAIVGVRIFKEIHEDADPEQSVSGGGGQDSAKPEPGKHEVSSMEHKN